jgi:hypothetical protein
MRAGNDKWNCIKLKSSAHQREKNCPNEEITHRMREILCKLFNREEINIQHI